MRINRLTIAGFGPYKTAQTIDFDAFDNDGIFLITGNTGAGKSSILDAVCFALYASVPRYDGTQQQLRSHYCEPGDPTYIELWFSSGGKSYRVRRSPDYDQPKKRGEGTTKKPTSAELFVRVTTASMTTSAVSDGDWEGIAAIPREVGIALDGILGLTKDQFLQVILLAQNRFQKFLHAKNDERQAVLQSLFGTRRFAGIERLLVERRKALEARQTGSSEAIARLASEVASIVDAQAEVQADPQTEGSPQGPLQLRAAAPSAVGAPEDLRESRVAVPEPADRVWFERSLVRVREAVGPAEARVVAADVVFDDADAAFRSLENTRRLQQRRDSTLAKLIALERVDEAIDEDRLRLDEANRAEIVWAHVGAAKAAGAGLERAERQQEAAHIAYSAEASSEQKALAEPTPEGLAAQASDLSRLLGSLDVVLADERRLPGLERELEDHARLAAASENAVATAIARVESLPPRIDAVLEQRSSALVAAAANAGLAQSLPRLVEARAAAVLEATLAKRVDETRSREKTQSTANVEAAARYDDLLTRRLDGQAADLASKLVDDEPCSVCGSTTHPNPATWSTELGDQVTDTALEDARLTLTRAAEALQRAAMAVHDASAERAAADAAAGGRSLADLDTELVDSRFAEAEVAAAGAEATELTAEAARLRSELDETSAVLGSLRSAAETTRTVLAAARTERSTILERVSQQSGEFDSVQERVRGLQLDLEKIRDYEAAMIARAERQHARDAAVATLEQQVAEQGFVDPAAVTRARFAPDVRTSTAARITAHDVASATCIATLAEAELLSLPQALVELADAAEARTAARTARDDSRVAASSVLDRLKRLGAVVADALGRLDASEALMLEFETLRSLANSVEGNEPNTMRMRLESYVLAAQLEQIIFAANARLATMTAGRYTLQHDDSLQYRNTRSGLGIAILDEHTGRARATHSLSGGETFLASLALALGLAEVVSNQAGGITLDTLFIDEGFGSLDADTLAIAMSTLDSLRAGGRTIGLISHVEAMKEQIPSRLHISVSPRGWSEIDQRS